MAGASALAGHMRRATWAAWWLLLGQQALDAFLLQQPWFIWLLKLLPLALFVPGMLAGRLRSYIWLCFVSLGYFVILVQRIFAAPGDVRVIVGLVAVVVLFVCAMLYVRWRARELREQGQGAAPMPESRKNEK